MSDTSALPGWYGKLSSLGDFAQRRLPPAWVQNCDAWLSHVMQRSSEQLGERWLQTYLTAPVLRFAWAPGVLDNQWWFGLLMPSCDNVGRYYPLLIAQPRARPPVDRIALDHLELWYTHLANAALQTLGDHTSLDAFERALAEAPPWPTAGPTSPLNTRSTPTAERYEMPAAVPLSRWLPSLATTELLARVAGCTLWWRTADDGTGASVSLVHRLPGAETFVELLAGRAG
ncbi:type VI secretion system-associated protein TagF [Ideonella sp.]|uniref:type VI secretion system-associated protein TagF n=1 Tax=Ideonella sp. TaxID=1929293 RepID=UPI0035B495B1